MPFGRKTITIRLFDYVNKVKCRFFGLSNIHFNTKTGVHVDTIQVKTVQLHNIQQVHGV